MHIYLKKPLIVLIFSFIFCVINGNSKGVSDFSFFSGSGGFNRYSVSYLTSLSTYVFSGLNYTYYKTDSVKNISSFKLITNYVNKNYIFSIKPFYYPEKDFIKSYGIKTGFGFISGMDDVFTTYYFSTSLIREKQRNKNYSDTLIESSIEKNYYDEFFIMVRGLVNLSYNKKTSGYMDYMDVANYAFNGIIDYTIYSDIGLNFARSFKPDFNSYLYISFDRINGYVDDINSYVIGLKTFLDDKENYYMDFNYNFADFKKCSNEKFIKISLGANF